MATYCLDSVNGVGGLGDGTSWDDAYENAANLPALSAGDIILVNGTPGAAHAGTRAAKLTLTGSATNAAPVYFVAVDIGASSTATQNYDNVALEGNAQASETTTANVAYEFVGNFVIYGMTWGGANGGIDSTFGITPGTNTNVKMHNCRLEFGSTSTSQFIFIGHTGGSSAAHPCIEFDLVEIKFLHVSQTIQIRNGDLKARRLTIDATGSVPTVLFDTLVGDVGTVYLEDSDISGGVTTLYDFSTTDGPKFISRNVKLPVSGGALSSTTPPGSSSYAEFFNTSNGGDQTMFAGRYHNGDVDESTTVYRDAADVDSTGYSIEMAPTSLCEAGVPLYGPEIPFLHDGTVAIDVSLFFAIDEAATVTDDQIGFDLSSQQSTPDNLVSTSNTGDLLTAGANLTDIDGTDAANWTGTGGFTNRQIFKITISSVTPGRKGFLVCRPWVRNNFTNNVFVNPLPLIEVV